MTEKRRTAGVFYLGVGLIAPDGDGESHDGPAHGDANGSGATAECSLQADVAGSGLVNLAYAHDGQPENGCIGLQPTSEVAEDVAAKPMPDDAAPPDPEAASSPPSWNTLQAAVSNLSPGAQARVWASYREEHHGGAKNPALLYRVARPEIEATHAAGITRGAP